LIFLRLHVKVWYKAEGDLFMAKVNLITGTKLKRALNNLPQDELVGLIADIAKACPQAKEYLTIKFADEKDTGEIFESYKKKVEHEFFPPRGYGRLNLREAKKAISDFKKICSDKKLWIDLMLFYVKTALNSTAPTAATSENRFTTALLACTIMLSKKSTLPIWPYTYCLPLA